MNTYVDDLSEAQEKPIADLSAQLNQAVADANSFVVRCTDAYDTRYCLWAGQSDSGRKERGALGKEPFPWENASDTRIRMADEVVNDNAIIMTAALVRSQIQATPTESLDSREAATMTIFLKWLRKNVLAETIRKECPLLANWQEMYGLSVLAISWEQEVKRVMVPTTIADIQGIAEMAAAQGDPQGQIWLEMLDAVYDPSREEEVAAWLRSLHPLMDKRSSEAAVRRLRLEGMFEAPRPIVTKNQPCWTALRPFRDIFFPANCDDLATAPWIALREVVYPGELRSRVLTENYDEEAVEEAHGFVGGSVLDHVRYDRRTDKISVVDEMKGMIEVFCFYRKTVDEEGFTKIAKTTFCPPGTKPLKHEDDGGYAHAEYPFVDFVRNRTERLLIENRGVPVLSHTQQTEVKTQRDYRSDRSSISIMPPVKVPMNRPNLNLVFGPARQIGVRRMDEVDFMRLPPADPDTVLIEQQVKLDVNNYFARWADGVHPTRQALYSQKITDDWLGGFGKVFKQTLMLCREYMDDKDFARVTGVAMPFALGNEEALLRQYDVILDFSAANLNMELVLGKLKAVNEAILPADTFGIVNRPALIRWGMSAIDPSLAEATIQDEQTASNAEIEDEQLQYSKIFGGTEPEMKAGGQNAALRLQVLQTILQRNPNVQQRYAADEIFRKMMDARMQHFNFQLQQRQNAQIGRMGAMPALSEVNQARGGMPAAAAGAGLGAPGPAMGPQGPQAMGAPAGMAGPGGMRSNGAQPRPQAYGR